MAETDLQPFEDWVLVEQEEEGEVSPGGIILVGESRELSQRPVFKVLRVGPGRQNPDGTRRPLRCAVGDRVIVRRTVSVEIPEGERVFYLVQDGDVIARVG